MHRERAVSACRNEALSSVSSWKERFVTLVEPMVAVHPHDLRVYVDLVVASLAAAPGDGDQCEVREPAERGELREEGGGARILPHLEEGGMRLSRHEEYDLHVAFQGAAQCVHYRGRSDGRVLHVDRLARGGDCGQVLLERALLAACHREGLAAGSGRLVRRGRP